MTTTTQQKTKNNTSKTVESQLQNLPANPFLFEIFNLISKQRSNAKKLEILKKYEHPSIKAVFIWNFDDTIISVLPPGEVPYSSVGEQNSFSGTLSEKINDAVSKMNELGSSSLGATDQGYSTIRKEYKMFYNFIKG